MPDRVAGSAVPPSAALLAFARAHRDVPTLTAYLNRRSVDATGRNAQRVELQHALHVERRRLNGESRATRAAFDSCESRLHVALARGEDRRDAPAFACFVCANGDELIQPLAVGVETSAAWRHGPRIAPCLLAAARPPAIVALVSSEHASIFRLTGEALSVIETRDDHPDVELPAHMGTAPRDRFHTGTRGETQTDAAERVRREAHARHVTATAHRIAALAGHAAGVVVGGSSGTVPLVVRALPAEFQHRVAVADTLLATSTVPEIVALASDALRQLAATRQAEVAANLLGAARHSHHSALGFGEVSQAVTLRAVDHLLVSSSYLRRFPDAVDDAVKAVLDEGGLVDVLDGDAGDALDAAAAGIAARLRFPLAPAPVALRAGAALASR